MKVSHEKLENCAIRLTIELDNEEVEQALQKTARKISQKTNIPGFRRGKAPYQIVLQTFGRQALLEEALDDLGQEVFEKALKEAGIEPYAQAKLEDVQMEPLVLKLRVPIAPTVDLGDYRSLRLDAPPVEVTDEQVEEALNPLREQNATWAPVSRGAVWGDQLTITYSRNQGKTSDPVDIVLKEDSNYPMPGFQSRLLGATAGSELTFDLTYPADWPDEAQRGQIQAFRVLVSEVKERELPPLEELPALIGDYENLDALRAGLRADLTEKEQKRNDQQLTQKALDILLEQAKIEYPPEAEEEELERVVRRQDTRLRQQGLSLENYLKIVKQTQEQFAEQQRPLAIRSLKTGLILKKLVELEGLQVEKDELAAELAQRAETADHFMDEKAANELVELLETPAGQAYVASEMLTDKAYERLLAIVKGQAPELRPAEATSSAELAAEPPAPTVGAEAAQEIAAAAASATDSPSAE